jgi:hypothetical protein
MGGRQNHKKKKKKNHESPGLVAMPIPIEPQTDRLSRGDSYTLLGLLLGVLFVLVVPPFWLKVPGLVLVCISCIGFTRKSHWTHQWKRSKQLWIAISAIIVVCLVSIPQLASQWKSEHPVPTPISSSAPIPLSSPVPIPVPHRIPVKLKSKKVTEKPLVIPSPTPVPLTADELADKVVQRIADQRPVSTPTPMPTPTPKPLCRGDNLSICTDEDLLEWGKPLMHELDSIFGLWQRSTDKIDGIDPNNHAKRLAAYVDAENYAAKQYKDCCGEDAMKYYKQLSARIGGGTQKASYFEWTRKISEPENSHDWKDAALSASTMIMFIKQDLGHLELALRFKPKQQGR